jgi:DNA-binding beta-propeller fold protein YncE
MRALLRWLSVLALAMISLSAVAQVTIATLPVGSYPDVVAVNTTTNQIYTVNAQCYSFPCSTQGTVTVTDGVTHNVVGTVNVGYSPADTIVNPTTNKIYVANVCGNDPTCQSPGTVTVINGATLQTTTVPVGYAPGFSLHGIAINQTTNEIYVANECSGGGWPTCPPGNGTVTVINGSTLATQSVTASRKPINLAVDAQTNMIYVANVGTPGGSNSTVTVINGTTLATQTVNTGYRTEDIQLDATTNQIYASNLCGSDPTCQSNGTVTVIDGATLNTQTVAAGYEPFFLAVNAITNTIYVANNCSDSSCMNKPTITAINGSTLSTTAVSVCNAMQNPGDLEVNTVTNKIYIPCENFGTGMPPGQTVTVIDGATNATFPIAVGDQPNSIAINSVTNTMYTPNLLDNTISVIGGDAKLQLVNVTPCRLVDTRKSGGPIPGGTSESFTLPQLGGCNIPTTAAAYSLNVTVVPSGQLGYLTIWPTPEIKPVVSTMNSLDGRIKANAASVQAGVSGAVSVYVSNSTNVVLDIDGYFAPSGQTLEFYPLAPCRVLDTRNATGPLGGPYLTTQQERDFPVLSSDCNIPSSAQAYSMNFTVVPYQGQSLGYLTVWAQGGSQPVVSTLNNLTATIVANAAIVPAGTGGGIATYPSGNTQLVADIDGYFAPAGTGGLSLYPTAPCRVVDTRKGNGAFGGELTVNVVSSACTPPSSALAYVFNATVVPVGGLGYLTLWPDTEQQPRVSTLNAIDGAITSNMAIVPNINGKTDAYASGITQLILDISSFFAP